MFPFKSLIFLVSFLTAIEFANSQSKKEFSKHLSVFTSDQFDKRSEIVFERKNPKKHGWDKFEDGFTKTFKDNGFLIGPLSRSNDTLIPGKKYKMVVDYDYGYLIYAYKMQFSNLKMEVIDLGTKQSIGSIQFDDRFNISETAEAIARTLNAKPLPVENASMSTKVARSKEEQLRELKDLYDKKLINEQDYESQKKKILEQ